MAERIPRPPMPTREQGDAAHMLGQDAALLGKPATDNPWDRRSPDSITRALGAMWRHGYAYGRQVSVQRKYGDPPTIV